MVYLSLLCCLFTMYTVLWGNCNLKIIIWRTVNSHFYLTINTKEHFAPELTVLNPVSIIFVIEFFSSMFEGPIKEKYSIILFQLKNLPRELSCDEQHTFDHKYSVILVFNHLYSQLLHQSQCWYNWFAGLLGLNSVKCLRNALFEQGNRSIKLLMSLEFKYNKVLLWIPIQKEELGSKVSSHPS